MRLEGTNMRLEGTKHETRGYLHMYVFRLYAQVKA